MTRKPTFSLADKNQGKVPLILTNTDKNGIIKSVKLKIYGIFIMKRLIAAILSLTLVFSVSACGNSDNDSTTSEKDSSVTTATTKATTSLSGNAVSVLENSDSDTSSSNDTVVPENAAPLSYEDFNMNTHHVFDKEYSNVIDAQSQYVAGYYSPDSPDDPNAADSSGCIW